MVLVIAQTLVNGVLLGGVYLLAAVGLSLVFGVLRIVNLAHGDFVMLGAYVAFVAVSWTALSPAVALAMSISLGLGLGLTVYYGVMDRLRNSDEMEWLLVTFGLSAVVVGGVRYVFGPTPHFLNLYSGSYFLGPVYLPKARLAAFVLAVALAGGLSYILHRSRMGKAVRAVASNLELAAGMGLPIRRLMGIAFTVATCLAVVGGSMLISVYSVDPEIGGSIVFKSFAILALAGFGRNISVALAALALGAGEALLSLWIPQSVANILAFAALLVVILVRPPEVLAHRGIPG